MKRFLPELTVLMVGVFALATARGENIVGELPTLENVERAWRASYASPYDKFQTVSRLIGKMKRYQSDSTKVDLAKSGENLGGNLGGDCPLEWAVSDGNIQICPSFVFRGGQTPEILFW